MVALHTNTHTHTHTHKHFVQIPPYNIQRVESVGGFNYAYLAVVYLVGNIIAHSSTSKPISTPQPMVNFQSKLLHPFPRERMQRYWNFKSA